MVFLEVVLQITDEELRTLQLIISHPLHLRYPLQKTNTIKMDDKAVKVWICLFFG